MLTENHVRGVSTDLSALETALALRCAAEVCGMARHPAEMVFPKPKRFWTAGSKILSGARRGGDPFKNADADAVEHVLC